MSEKGETTRERILDAAETLILSRGFAGTSLDDILKEVSLTKGAFFHYFKGKGDLARALIERHARTDMALFDELAARAEASSEDPLEQTLSFLQNFEKEVSARTDQPPGCLLAVYTYESLQFDPSINDYVADSLKRWTAVYVRKFEDVLARYRPAAPVTARQLGEMIVSIIEGGLILARAYGDVRFTARQSEQFRNYLGLLFGAPNSAMAKSAGSKKRRSRAKEHA